MAPPRFVPSLSLEPSFDGPHLAFVFAGRRLLLIDGTIPVAAPEALGLPLGRVLHLGRFGDHACHAIELDPAADPDGETVELLVAAARLDPVLFALAGRASQMLEWDRTHRFCGACATPTEPHPEDRARVCPACGLLCFPRLSPAIIVAVERGDEILLARSSNFPPGIYSVLAGFVEPGETAEECVRREVFEETGVEVDDIRYFASQPWPFPHSLMLGFTARYVSGDVNPAPRELEAADFFHVDALPRTFTGRVSISQWLLEDFRRRKGRR